MSYLQKLPLERLKVDRSFIVDITKPGKSLIADTIISLGKQMNLKVIAEGVEDEHPFHKTEGFGGKDEMNATDRKKFERKRKDNAEVLGLELTGTEDVREAKRVPRKVAVKVSER